MDGLVVADPKAPCATRDVLDRIGDAWSVLAVLNLRVGPCRFNPLKRRMGGITQRMLTVTLRGLERDGLVSRQVFPTTPPAVEYALTPLGRSLGEVVDVLHGWAEEHRPAIRDARRRFDSRADPLGASAPDEVPRGELG